MQLPDELKLQIYNESDFETRIKLNKEFGWNFKNANPLKEICHTNWKIYYNNNTKILITTSNIKILEPGTGTLSMREWATLFFPEPEHYQPSGIINIPTNWDNWW